MTTPTQETDLPLDQRSDPTYARQVIERLLPDEHIRRVWLTQLADSIEEANRVSSTSWEVTLQVDRVRLNVGPIEVLFQHRSAPEQLYLVLDKAALSATDSESVKSLESRGGEYAALDASLGVYVPFASIEQLLPQLREAHLSIVRKAAHKKRVSTWAKYHSPGAVEYLRDALGRDVPQPGYWSPAQAVAAAAQPDGREASAERDWRACLAEWLKSHPKTMPDGDCRLLEEFHQRFPKEKLGEMTLEQYAVGQPGQRDTFWYWLEWKTASLGSIAGGSAAKSGVWWDKSENRWVWNKGLQAETGEAAFERIRNGLIELIATVEAGRFEDIDRVGAARLGDNRYSLRAKPLYLYFPDEFLPISNPDHLSSFLRVFGQTPRTGLQQRNLQLLGYLRSLPEFEGFDTLQMMRFLYDCFSPKTPGGASEPNVDEEVVSPLPTADVPQQMTRLLAAAKRTGNILLYGPPGTGKTWLVNHFANYYLLKNNYSEAKAGEYWQAVETKDRPKAKALAEEARREPEKAANQSKIWWVGINPNTTSFGPGETWKTLTEEGTQVVEVSADREMRVGDYALCYLAHVKEIVALAMVTATGLPQSSKPGVKQAVTLKLVARLARPVPLQTLKTSASLAPNHPVMDALHPWVFELQPNDAREVVRVLNDYGNNVSLPEVALGDTLEFVTFHQSFGYEDFIEGLRPLPPDDDTTGVQYDVVPGVFRRIADRAERAWRAQGDNAPRYLLIIDEINRANIAKVFGELITLIEDDKRLGEDNQLTVTLPASGQPFGVPPNLTILGTMNTADRSIALLDLALRRRFTFVELMPNITPLADKVIDDVPLDALLTRLNQRVAALLDRDHQIGHSYLLDLKDLDGLRFAWYHRIVPLLQEYFYNDGERLKAVLGTAFMEPTTVDTAVFESPPDFLDGDATRWEVKTLEGDTFVKALKALAGVSQ